MKTKKGYDHYFSCWRGPRRN